MARHPHGRTVGTSAPKAFALGSALVLWVLLVLPAFALAQSADAEPLPEPGTALEPGRYTSSAVGPSIDFRVEDGWLVGPTASGPIFVLERVDQPGTVLSVTRFDGDAFLDSCDPTSLSRVEPTVPRLMEIIAGNPYLNPGPLVQLEVDGYQGLRLDVATPVYTECNLPYLLIWALPIAEGGEFVQVADQQSRFIVLDVDGDVVVIAIESFPGVPFGGLLDASMELLGSMRIEPGEYMPPEPVGTAGPDDADEAPVAPAVSPSPTPPGGAGASA